MLINLLKCGFYSQDTRVIEHTMVLFRRIMDEYDKLNKYADFFDWYIQTPTKENNNIGGGLDASIFIFNKFTEFREPAIEFMTSAFRGNLHKLLPALKENQGKDKKMWTQKFLNETAMMWIKYAPPGEFSKYMILNSGIIQESIKQTDNTGKFDKETRSTNLSLIAELWSLDPALIQDNDVKITEDENVLQYTLTMFKKATRDKSKAIKMGAMGLMFYLLEKFAAEKNTTAPVFYKILVYSMVEGHSDDIAREQFMR